MTSKGSQSQVDRVKSLFDQAQPLQEKVEATIPTDVIMVGGYRKVNVRKEESSFPYGEIAFEWNGTVLIKQLSQAVKGCPDYSTVVFATRGVGLDFDIIGAGKTKKVSIIQHFNWNDFAESDTIASLERYCVAATKKLTLRGQKSLIWKTSAENRLLITSSTIAIYALASVNNESLEVKISKVIFRKDFDEALEPMLEKRSFLEKDFSFCPPENLGKVKQILDDLTDARSSVGWIKDDFNEFCREHNFFIDNDKSHLAPFILARTVYKLVKKQSRPYTIGEIQEVLKENLQDTNQFADEKSIESVMKDNTRIFQLVTQSGTTSFTLRGTVKSNYAREHFWEMPIPADVLSALWLEAHDKNAFPDAEIAEAEDKKEVSVENLLTHSDERLADGQAHTVSEDGKTDMEETNGRPGKEKEPTMTEEQKAIVSFWKKLKEAGWNYSLRDIVRFHTSVKTGALTILAGASGTGKSSLFKLYSRFATGTDEFPQEQKGTEQEQEQGKIREGLWKRVNVVSTWMEPSDLLGWNNPMAREGEEPFQKAPGGLFDFLDGLQSQDEKEGKISLLCFEEMNLAQAELYFSDFLQAISDPPEERKITNPKGEDFKIPGLRIVGTCNVDHTTKPFTERFLDRCNYIDLSSPDTEKSIEEFFSTKLPDERPALPQPSKVLYPKKEISDEAIKQVSEVVQESKWKELITVICKLQILPSPRVRNAMLEYILLRPALKDTGGISSTPDAYYIDQQEKMKLGLDEAFVQRVLPKLLLRGEWDKDDLFVKQIGKLSDLCQANELDLPLAKAFLDNHLTNGSRG